MAGKKTEGSGRKKGTPNKRTLALKERMAELGCDPIEFMAKIVNGDMILPVVLGVYEGAPIIEDMAPSYEIRVSCAKELAMYLYPKRKAIEVSNALDGEGNTKPFIVAYDTLPGWLERKKELEAEEKSREEGGGE